STEGEAGWAEIRWHSHRGVDGRTGSWHRELCARKGRRVDCDSVTWKDGDYAAVDRVGRGARGAAGALPGAGAAEITMTLRPLRIGPLAIGFPVVQAALSGYSDWPMRLLARRHGASYALCEVMLDQFLVTMKDNRQRNRHFLHITDDERPVGGQLMGAEPEQFARGAQKLVQAGFDVIDINFGCPVKKVLGRCRGGFHLSQPEVALEIVRRTRDAVAAEIPVTVKMRRGIDDSAEAREKFFAIF